MSDRDPQYSASESKRDVVPLTKAQLAIACGIEAATPEMCPHMRLKDECGFCAADERRAGVERRIECEKIAAVQEFIDRVLGILRAVGMPTDDCDGDEAPETILSGWIIANWMDASHRVKELEQDKCGLAADALNARQLLREFMAYVKCGQVPEDAHCVRRAKQLLASDLLAARATKWAAGVRSRQAHERSSQNESP